MPDIVGIGMINLDYIIDSQKALSFNPRDPALRLARFEHGVERPVDRAEIEYAMAQMRDLEPHISPGGSALNTIAAIAGTAAPVSVGYIGVCGTVRGGSFHFPSWFTLLDIDTTYVWESSTPVGSCVSYTQEAERAMLTWGGANDQLPDFLRNHRSAVIDYLSRSRVVHVAALAAADPLELVSIMLELKASHPAVVLSVDPGHIWTRPGHPSSVDQLLSVADFVFLNSREFDLFTQRLPNMSDIDAARLAWRNADHFRAMIVLKRFDSTVLFAHVAGDVLERRYTSPVVLAPEDVVDDTGVGDVFAAGFLVCRLFPGFDTRDAVEMGLAMARRKLLSPGLTRSASFQQDFASISAEVAERERRRAHRGNKARVFIGHGGELQWLPVRDFLTELGIKVTYFESTAAAGRFVNEVLASQALEVDFAVIVVTGEDVAQDGRVRGRQNLVHEIGLMQGRLGWSRVAILLEDGVESFSNLDGLQVIRFSGLHVQQTFHELQRMLEREGII